MLRKIIHIDLDAFYASVEMRDNPSLKKFPIAVGGDPKGRGVIATANYKARKYGVRSAMPSWKALKLCPDLIIVHPNFEKYKQESYAIKEIFHAFTDLIEPLSLDEAYLDVSDSQAFGGSATLIAKEIRRRIFEERRLTASAGVAPNKFLAKVASDWKKPNGLFVVTPNEVEGFVKKLPVENIFGIGRVMAKKLHAYNIYTCEDLQHLDLDKLQEYFGNRAWSLHELCRGIDNSLVKPERVRKSISVELTFVQDLLNLESCLEKVEELFKKLSIRYKKIENQYLMRKPFVKIKFSNFLTTTVENSLYSIPNTVNYQELIKIGWERKKEPVRLLGIGFDVALKKEEQLILF